MILKEIRSSKLAQPVTFAVFNWNVPGFNLDWDTLYPQVVVVSFISPEISYDNT
jgi:hypothetical protein